MFYSCLLNYGMRSEIYHQNLINAYDKFRDLFNPNYIITIQEEELKNLLIKYIHPRYPNIGAKKWMKLSKKLINFTSLDTYLKNIKSLEKLKSFIKDLECYGQKTGNLLIRIICDTGICDFNENINSIPIDRHDIRISYLTNIIEKEKLNEKEIEELSRGYVEVGVSLGINPSNIDKYLWEVGSSICNKKKCKECPIKTYCKGSESNG